MSRINLFVICSLVLAIFSCSPKSDDNNTQEVKETSSSDDKSAHGAEIEALLAKMSLEEKVGQMTQLNLNTMLYSANGSGYDNNIGTINPALLDTIIGKYKVGSILNAINHAYTLEQWHGIVKQIQDKAMSTGSKIPVIYGIDAIHGVTFTLGSTLFPHNIGTAASWNPENAALCAKVTAKEARASGLRWNFDPVLDLGRNPLWPRFPETFGEDPLLIEKMGVAAITAYEEDGLDQTTAVASCMKHFIGYSASRSGRDRTPSYIPEIELREYYLPQFRAAVKAGSSTIMINSGELNGVPVHASKYLLTDVLRGELGFKGVVVTDWEDVNRIHERHNVASTLKEAVKISVLAGIDMSMTPHDLKFAKLLVELVEEGEVPMERINTSVRRILQLKYDLGLFENPYVEEEAIANFGKEEYAKNALDAARETITLLKNENNALPLKKGAKIVVAGPNANNLGSLHGSWSYTWQGAQSEAKILGVGDPILGATEEGADYAKATKDSILTLYPESTLTIKEALEAKIGAGNVVCKSVEDYDAAANYELPSVAGADAIVLCLGENAYAESPGSIRDLTLDEKQIALAKKALKTGKPVILVLVEGRPRIISSFVGDVDGVIHAYIPGSQGANAISDVLFGDYNPGGKLPFTYPKYAGDVVAYDHKWTERNVEESVGVFTDTGFQPQWPFGFGLSYTTFEYSDFTLSADTLVGNDVVTGSVTVTNTGDVAGDEVVQLYTRDMYATITPSLKRLKDFERVSIEAGESKTVTFEIDKGDLSFISYEQAAHKYARVTEEGDFKIMIGALSTELEEPEFPWTSFLSRTFKNSKSLYYKN